MLDQPEKNLINLRFGPGSWGFFLKVGKKRIDAKKQAIKEAKAAKLKKQKEMYEMIRRGFIVLAVISFIAVAIGITVKIVLAHSIEYDDDTCLVYDPKYFMICMNEGREFADTELYLEYKKQLNNWIVDDDKKQYTKTVITKGETHEKN